MLSARNVRAVELAVIREEDITRDALAVPISCRRRCNRRLVVVLRQSRPGNSSASLVGEPVLPVPTALPTIALALSQARRRLPELHAPRRYQ